MKFRTLFALLGLLALCSLAFGQANTNQMGLYSYVGLTMACDGSGGAIPDGMAIEIRNDNNGGGQEDTDPVPAFGTGPGQLSWSNPYAMVVNGAEYNGIPGSFYNAEYLFMNGGGTNFGALLNGRFYLRIQTASAIWRSGLWGFSLSDGGSAADLEVGGWTCTVAEVPCVAPASVTLNPGAQVCWQACPPPACTVLLAECPAGQPPLVTLIPGGPIDPMAWVFNGGLWQYTYCGTARETVCAVLQGCTPPACTPTPLVQFFADRDNGVPNYYCADVCQGSSTVIRVCSYVVGAPLNPANTPIVTITPGCAPIVTGCARECAPGATDFVGLIPYAAWTYTSAGCFEVVIHGVAEGCVCVGLEGFLSAELSSFTATPASNSVTVDFATVSETNLSRFEVIRTVKGHEEGTLVGTVDATNAATGHTYNFVDNSAVNGTNYVYSLAVVELDGSRRVFDITTEATPSYNAAVITEYALQQNFPNPFNPTTQITFDLVNDNVVTLKVFNMNGQLVNTLVNGSMPSGRHTITFDSKNLTSGLYFYSVKIGNEFSATKKMMLVK